MSIWIVITIVAGLIAAGSFYFIRKVILSSALASVVTATVFATAMAISGEKFAVIGALSVLFAAAPIALVVSVAFAKILQRRQRRA